MATSTSQKTSAEARAHKRQVELLNEDAKRLCSLDVQTPFRSLQDAVDRLLPFHIFGALEPDAADLEEVQGVPNPELIISRSHQVSQQIHANAMEAVRRVESLRQRVDAAQQRYSLPPALQHTLLPEDRYMIARAALQEAREQLDRERRKPPGYMTPDREEEMVEVPEPELIAVPQEGPAAPGVQQQQASIEAAVAAAAEAAAGTAQAAGAPLGMVVQGAGAEAALAGAAGEAGMGMEEAALVEELQGVLEQVAAAEQAAGVAASEEGEDGESLMEPGEGEGEEEGTQEGEEEGEGEEIDEGEVGEQEEGEGDSDVALDEGAEGSEDEYGEGEGDGEGDGLQEAGQEGEYEEDVSSLADDDDDDMAADAAEVEDTDMQDPDE